MLDTEASQSHGIVLASHLFPDYDPLQLMHWFHMVSLFHLSSILFALLKAHASHFWQHSQRFDHYFAI